MNSTLFQMDYDEDDYNQYDKYERDEEVDLMVDGLCIGNSLYIFISCFNLIPFTLFLY